MNLCVVCRDVTMDVASGLVRATCDLSEALVDEGHEVHLLTDGAPSAAPPLRGVSVERVTAPPASGGLRGAALGTARHDLMHAAAAYREVRRIHEHERPVDAVLAPLWRSEGVVCLLDDRFPTVVSCMTSLRTLVELDPSHAQLPDIDERLALERTALARSRYLHGLTGIALSKTLDDFGLDPAMTAVIGRGLRDRRIPRTEDTDIPRVLFVGRIEPRKGTDTLLEAAVELLEAGVSFNLTLAGPLADPSIRARFDRESAGRPGLAEAVEFAGGVSDARLMRLYADADVVCVPSRYESHGVVLVEAMMFGKPIVACNGGAVGEVVDPGHNALVAPPEDAGALACMLRRAVEEPRLRAQLGAAARATFERRFDARAVAQQMESFLAEAIAAHRPARATGPDVDARLQQLLREVLAIPPGHAATLAAELLDPAAGEGRRRLRGAALEVLPARNRRRATNANGTPRIVAVVLTRDRPALLERTLDSLEESSAPVHVLVLDSASTHPNAERVAAICASRSGVRLERLEANRGRTGGRQRALELSDSELVLFLEDDAELLPGAVDHLLADLDAHRDAAAVTATVVRADGIVVHSGGSLEPAGGLVKFDLIGAGAEFGRDELEPSGSAGWLPGTAMLVRRELLEQLPLDQEMAGCLEDYEWCYRVAIERPACFRRSREALVVHHAIAELPENLGLATIARRVDLLTTVTRFYERHRRVLAPWTFDRALPELRAHDGTCDVAAAKVLMELLASKGREWMIQAWGSGQLGPVLEHAELEQARTELVRLRRAIAAQEETIALLYPSHLTLDRIVNGGWWRLRGRILPVIQFAGAVRCRLRGTGGSSLL